MSCKEPRLSAPMQALIWTRRHETISEFLPHDIFEVAGAPLVEHWSAQRKQLFISQLITELHLV